MRKTAFLALLYLSALVPVSVRANDAITPTTLEEMKNATVFVRAETERMLSTGSGLVIGVEGTTIYVATNHHVISPPSENPADRTPGKTVLHFPTIKLVLRSGGQQEQTVRGTTIVADPRRDLAILKATGVRHPPKPIDFLHTPRLMETNTVYIFGFPFGPQLATASGNPAVSVNRGTIASLRADARGELAVVQINGDMNPGNSGGPVVTADGHLVGIAFAVLTDPHTGQLTRIGLAIPHTVLPNLTKTFSIPTTHEEPAGVIFISVPSLPTRLGTQPLSEHELNAAVTDLKSPKDFQRCRAAQLLAKAKPTASVRTAVATALEPLLTASDTFTRKVGADAIGVWGGTNHVPQLIKLVEDREYKVRWAAMAALARLGDSRAMEPIAAHVVDEEDRETAVQALHEFGPKAESAIQPLVSHKDTAVRIEACTVLAALGTAASLSCLDKANADADMAVAAAAKRAIQAITARREHHVR